MPLPGDGFPKGDVGWKDNRDNDDDNNDRSDNSLNNSRSSSVIAKQSLAVRRVKKPAKSRCFPIRYTHTQ